LTSSNHKHRAGRARERKSEVKKERKDRPAAGKTQMKTGGGTLAVVMAPTVIYQDK
jgi:hypothetical protein